MPTELPRVRFWHFNTATVWANNVIVGANADGVALH